MDWYPLSVLAGKEDAKLLLLRRLFPDIGFALPRRRLSWRKNGQVLDVVKPLFAGYVFAITSSDRIHELDFWLRRNAITVHCVRSPGGIVPLPEQEVAVVAQLMTHGEVIEATEFVKVGNQVSIVRGPLFGMEGTVEEYSKRNRRVVIRVTLGGEVKRVSLEATFLDAGAKTSEWYVPDAPVGLPTRGPQGVVRLGVLSPAIRPIQAGPA